MEVDFTLLVIGLLFMFFVVMRYVAKAKIFNVFAIISAIALALLLNTAMMFILFGFFIIIATLDLFYEGGNV
jgi:hypothetical protein